MEFKRRRRHGGLIVARRVDAERQERVVKSDRGVFPDTLQLGKDGRDLDRRGQRHERELVVAVRDHLDVEDEGVGN